MKDYKKLEGELTPLNVASQAAYTLNLIGGLASEVKDTDTLLAVAKLWIDMVEVASHAVVTPADTPELANVVGFQRNEEEKYGRTESNESTDEDHS